MSKNSHTSETPCCRCSKQKVYVNFVQSQSQSRLAFLMHSKRKKKMYTKAKKSLGWSLGLMAALSSSSYAAEWSDTSIALSYGTEFSEPFKNNEDGSAFEIEKHIISLVHVSGYKYGSNFFQVNLHQSN